MISEERDGLRRIRRFRLWLWFFLLTYVPAIWMLRTTIHSDIVVAVFLLIWVVGSVEFTARTAFSRCPRCGHYFHSPDTTPSFWNLVTRKCMQCGLSLRADRVIYPSME
jgi:hypothetical protein